MNTNTPRTDYAAYQARIVLPNHLGATSWVVTVEFAKKLESELARATAERDEARRDSARMGKLLDRITSQTVVMGSTGDYREGQIRVLETIAKYAADAALQPKEQPKEQP